MTEIGISWYAEEQWPHYKRIMVDETDETYAEWKRKSEEAFDHLRKEGFSVRKVPIDLTEFELWCRASNKRCDGQARAGYVTHLLRIKTA